MSDISGTDWSELQVDLCVKAYFDCFVMELAGQKYKKSEVYRRLSSNSGRTPSAIEFKFQNISAVLEAIGLDWIRGLAPARNYQELLAKKVALYIDKIVALPPVSRHKIDEDGLAEPAAFFLQAPPELRLSAPKVPEFIASLVKKFDPVERDNRNRVLGDAGEQFVLEHEKRFLNHIGRGDLAKNVKWISKEEGDGAGYDILSFSESGERKFVEVKTTVGGNRTPFFISRNELSFYKQNQKEYSLVRLFDFRIEPKGFELRGRLEDYVKLSAESYRAEFQ